MYNLPNCHLSELAIDVDVDVDAASLDVQVHRDESQKARHKEAKKTRANQARPRVRRPTTFAIEHYRHEGDSDNEDDVFPGNSLDHTPRGRCLSPGWTPTHTRAPTPHPRASRPQRRNSKKTVRWAKELEQDSPVQKSEPVKAPVKTKSVLKRRSLIQQEEKKATEKEDGREKLSEADPMEQVELIVTTGENEIQLCTLCRDRRSSLPRPNWGASRDIEVSKPIAVPSVGPERPPNDLILQVVPAPLRIPSKNNSLRRGQNQAIPSSVSTPQVSVSHSQSLYHEYSPF